MKRWWMISALAVAALLASGPVDAQTSQDDDFGDDEEQQEEDRFAFGIGAGLVQAYRDLNYRVVANSRSIRQGSDPDILAVDGSGGVNGLDDAAAVAISPDGRDVYVAGAADNVLARFTRETSLAKWMSTVASERAAG